MNFAILHILCILTLPSVLVSGYGGYQERIPNGDQVPHSCKPNFIWRGVGHKQMQGGGVRNVFGQDFSAAGHHWTLDLCMKDSDGDGRTNGEELGDPHCVWKPGTAPERITGISHPGICDPWGSPQCADKNSWVKCDADVFKCPPIHEDGVERVDLRFPLTPVPNKVTTYSCMSFNLPSDDDYHIIATQPIINESRVMHHIVLFACDDNSELLSSPTDCMMGPKGCNTATGLWTLGLPGQCFNKEAGFRMGTRGVKRGVLQFHWTNPEKRSDLLDASGLTIYYTKKLRNNDAGSWTTGQMYLEIPPLMPRVVQQSLCSAECTRKTFNGSIFLTTGLNHMHYLGIKQYVKLIRSNGSELMLTNDEHYSYDSPVLHEYSTPIEVKPGDSLETVCTYRSLSRKTRTMYGDGSFDEMCYGIFNYYPVQALSTNNCLTKKEFEYCDITERQCTFVNMFNFTHPDTRSVTDRVMAACSYEGECLHGCRMVVEDIMNNHVCFKNGLAEAFVFEVYSKMKGERALEALRFVTAMKSCRCTKETPMEYRSIIGTGQH